MELQAAGTLRLWCCAALLVLALAGRASLATSTQHASQADQRVGRLLAQGGTAAAGRVTAAAAPSFSLPSGMPYNIGNPVGMRHIWVDPQAGQDGSSRGGSRAAALRTLAAAWARIPQGQQLAAGYHIHITRGTLGSQALPNYWESRWGSRQAPIIVEAADGRGSVLLTSPVNIYDVRHLHLLGLVVRSQFDPFHCERCTNLLLRDFTAEGVCPRGYSECGVQEAIKINQCQGVWIEHVVAGWANDNAFDCVACQYGHILDSRFHHSEWGVYLKGGSAYFIVAGNLITDHGSSGFAAGQGTGFEFMTAPWLQYEAYDIKLFNNIIRNVQGAGFGVWGCYDCLYAFNTLVGVGNRSHTMEVNLGGRSCDGNAVRCSANAAAGGWGPRSPGSEVFIPNRNVFIVNNVVYNPPGQRSQWQHVQVDGPRSNPVSPRFARADSNLVFRGNVVWNGGADMPLGVGGEACTAANPSCNTAQLLAENAFNRLRPDLSLSTWIPAKLGRLDNYTGLWLAIPAFPAWAGAVRTGRLTNAIGADRAGTARTALRNAPGAYVPPV